MPLKLIVKRNKPTTPEPSGRLANLCEDMEVAAGMLLEAEGLVNTVKGELVAEARAIRSAELRSGIVRGIKHGKVHVVWRESFSGMLTDNIPPFRRVFGDQYARVIEEETKVVLKKGTTLAAIEAAIGPEARDALSELLTITECVKPRKGASEACAEMFRNGDSERGEELLQIIEHCISIPQVKTK